MHVQAVIFTMRHFYVHLNNTVTSLSRLISLNLKAFLNLKNSNSMYKMHPDLETKI